MMNKFTKIALTLCLVTIVTCQSNAMNPENIVPRKGQGTIWSFSDGHDITVFSDDEKLLIEENFETLELDATGKPHFTNEYGEDVVEYTGLATDKNAERSWAKAEFAPSGYSPAHLHKERTEDYYVIEGQAKVIINGDVHELCIGDHIKIKPNQVHQVINASEKDKLVIIVKCSAAWVPDDYHIVSEVGSLKNIKW